MRNQSELYVTVSEGSGFSFYRLGRDDPWISDWVGLLVLPTKSWRPLNFSSRKSQSSDLMVALWNLNFHREHSTISSTLHKRERQGGCLNDPSWCWLFGIWENPVDNFCASLVCFFEGYNAPFRCVWNVLVLIVDTLFSFYGRLQVSVCDRICSIFSGGAPDIPTRSVIKHINNLQPTLVINKTHQQFTTYLRNLLI